MDSGVWFKLIRILPDCKISQLAPPWSSRFSRLQNYNSQRTILCCSLGGEDQISSVETRSPLPWERRCLVYEWFSPKQTLRFSLSTNTVCLRTRWNISSSNGVLAALTCSVSKGSLLWWTGPHCWWIFRSFPADEFGYQKMARHENVTFWTALWTPFERSNVSLAADDLNN